MKCKKEIRIRNALLEINDDYQLAVQLAKGEAISEYAYRIECELQHRLVMARMGLRDIKVFREAAQEVDRDHIVLLLKLPQHRGEQVS